MLFHIYIELVPDMIAAQNGSTTTLYTKRQLWKQYRNRYYVLNNLDLLDDFLMSCSMVYMLVQIKNWNWDPQDLCHPFFRENH